MVVVMVVEVVMVVADAFTHQSTNPIISHTGFESQSLSKSLMRSLLNGKTSLFLLDVFGREVDIGGSVT